MYAKSAVILAAAAATAAAVSADQKKQLDIILQDVGANINQYINLVSDPSSGITFENLPAGLIDIGEQVAVDPSDTSYTSQYDQVDIAGVSKFVTKLSWYSDRLAPQLDAAGVPVEAQAKATSKAPETTEAAPTTKAAETTAAQETSKAAETTEAAPTSKAAETTAAETTTKAAETSKAQSSKAAPSSKAQASKAQTTVAQAISQIGDGQIQATASVHQQTENAAAKAVAGLGAGAIAAVALLL